jgi:hypothetical protein
VSRVAYFLRKKLPVLEAIQPARSLGAGKLED